MRQLASGTHWAYAQPVIYPFRAGLSVPPELAVVMLKRFWSGQITRDGIVNVCRHYRPEQLVFYRGRGPEWEELLASGYRLVYEDEAADLYVAEDLARGAAREGVGVKKK